MLPKTFGFMPTKGEYAEALRPIEVDGVPVKD
jgi:hypothetical protein